MTDFSRRFTLFVALQLVVVLGLLGAKQLTLHTGVHVLLRVEPIDPVDLFRGEYVVLNYSFSEVQSDLIDGPPLTKGETIYVTLIRRGRFFESAGTSRTPPEGALAFLKGKVVSVTGDKKRYRVEYGIESWFVPRGTGPELEREGRRSDRQLVGEAVVDMRGNAVLRSVTIEPKS